MKFQIIAFYEFKRLYMQELPELRERLLAIMDELSVVGSIIIAEEGYNGTVCGESGNVEDFVAKVGAIFGSAVKFKSSFHEAAPFHTAKVKIKPEIVTFGYDYSIEDGEGTHVAPEKWNELIDRDDVVVLDTRNDYEFLSGTFRGAINPKTEKFSELPDFVARNLDPEQHTNVAMFCTGGIRCEKFAPYLRAQGFKNVFQLDGGILNYLEKVPKDEQLWEGECFVFDDRRTVNADLEPGISPDHSYTKGKKEKPIEGSEPQAK